MTESRAGFRRRRPADNHDVRRHNLALVLEHVLDHGPCARSEIAESTGLVRGSITALVAELIGGRLLRESATAPPERGRGRPLAPVEADGSHLAVAAVQIGADQVDLVAEDLAGRALAEVSCPHGRPMGRPDLVAAVAADLVRRVAGDLAGRGVSVLRLEVVMAAPVPAQKAVVPMAIDLDWVAVDLLGLLAERLEPFPFGMRLVNDANMAALAELEALRRAEPGHGPSSIAYLKSNTGIGGAAVSDGRLITGVHGTAMEPGHIVVDPGGRRCRCGRAGCLVTVAGPEVVLEAAGLSAVLAGRGVREALGELVRLVRSGDAGAVGAVRDAGRWVGMVVDNLAVLLDPDQVVLGGYWAEVFDELVGSVDPARGSSGLLGSVGIRVREPYLVPGRLGERASLTGAVGAARRELVADPPALIDRPEGLGRPVGRD